MGADPLDVSPSPARPGQTLEVRFPAGTDRGVAWVLETQDDGVWRPRFYLSAELHGMGPWWWHADDSEGRGWVAVARTGPGPDVLRVPDAAAPGVYRLCTVLTSHVHRTMLEVAGEPLEPRQDAHLTPAARGPGLAEQPLVMMTDYSADFPLWQGGGLAPTTLPLSDDLIRRLMEWQDFFEQNFHYDHGWNDRESEIRFVRTAFEIAPRLRAEVGPDVEVRLDLWPADPTVAAGLDPEVSS